MSLRFKKPAFIALGLIALISAAWLDYYLPEHTIATITGVEVKRTDKDGPISQKNPADGPTTDVYYIYTERPGEKIRVFRNEDTEWGWPFYFKFNAADVQAKAKSMEFEKRLAIITSYGWRINMFSMFPNVTKIESTEPDASTWSFFRWFWFGLWALVMGKAAIATWRAKRPLRPGATSIVSRMRSDGAEQDPHQLLPAALRGLADQPGHGYGTRHHGGDRHAAPHCARYPDGACRTRYQLRLRADRGGSPPAGALPYQRLGSHQS